MYDASIEPRARVLLLLALLGTVLALGTACRDGGDGDADGDADGDVDGDVDGDADGDADGDGGGPCTPLLGGPCNAVDLCGCDEGEACELTVEGGAVTERCGPDSGSTAGHEADCSAAPCAAGHVCLGTPTGGGVCLRLCADHGVCPERSLCNVGFTMSELDPSPYRACSPVMPEAETSYGTCVGAAGACPSAGLLAERELTSETATWSCEVDLTEADWITVSFEVVEGDSGVVGRGLRARRSPSSLPPATCEVFEVVEGGVTYAPSECMPGLPADGTCVVSIRYVDGGVTGTFNCRALPATTGGTELLSTMNGDSLGMGSFDLRVCEVTGE